MSFLDPVTMVYLCVLFLETMAGIFINVFIIIVTFVNNCRRQDKKVLGNILLTLSIFSICSVSMLLLNSSTYLFSDWIFRSRHLLHAVRFLTFFTSHITSWLSSCLCFFYFVKIVNINCGVYIWVRMNISKVMTAMMVGSAMMSAMSSSFIFIDLTKDFSRNLSAAIVNDNYDKEHIKNTIDKQKFFLFLNFAPFLIVVVTIISTLISLKMHRQRMNSNLRVNMSGFRGVIRTMVGFLICYGLFFVVTFLHFFSVFVWPQPGFLVVNIFIFSLNPTHSGLIIYGTPRLRKAWLQMVHFMKCNDL